MNPQHCKIKSYPRNSSRPWDSFLKMLLCFRRILIPRSLAWRTLAGTSGPGGLLTGQGSHVDRGTAPLPVSQVGPQWNSPLSHQSSFDDRVCEERDRRRPPILPAWETFALPFYTENYMACKLKCHYLIHLQLQTKVL